MDQVFTPRFPFDLAEENITVFWDIDDCKIPEGKEVGDVAENIKSSLRDCSFNGKFVSMIAYGDPSVIGEGKLASAGFEMAPIPNEHEKQARVAAIEIFLWRWAVDHRSEQSNLLVIVGDMSQQFDIAVSLSKLFGKGFNILLSQPTTARGGIFGAARKVWLWSSLALGGEPVSMSLRDDLANVFVKPIDYCFDEEMEKDLDDEMEKEKDKNLEKEKALEKALEKEMEKVLQGEGQEKALLKEMEKVLEKVKGKGKAKGTIMIRGPPMTTRRMSTKMKMGMEMKKKKKKKKKNEKEKEYE